MMHTAKEYLEIVNSNLSRINYPSAPAGLYEPIRYTLEAGGKRVRPVLVLAACEAFGKSPEYAVNQALGLEMFHNFTLLHDDLMDHSPMRRGRETVYVKWDERTAILSGDAMLTMASMLMRGGKAMELDRERFIMLANLFDRTAMEVYEGQQYDMDFESRTDVKVGEYTEMIRLKTSVLLACACQAGAIMGGADEDAMKAMYRYGELLGLAFQLQDDYLDTYGDSATFGKPIGGDILNEKKTWLLISAMEQDKSGALVSALALEGSEKIDAVRTVYDSLGLADKCRVLIDEYSHKAVEALPETLDVDAREFFTMLAIEAGSRNL